MQSTAYTPNSSKLSVRPSGKVTKYQPFLKNAELLTGILLFGIFIDYTGTFGIKLILGMMVTAWVLLHRSSWQILLKTHKLDLIVLLLIPVILNLFHFVLAIINPGSRIDPFTFVMEAYHTSISSAMLILLFPLFYSVPTERVMRQIDTGFRAVAAFILVIFFLSVTGIINVGYGTPLKDFLSRFGAIGPDARLTGGISLPQITAGVAFPMPFAFGWELASPSPWLVVMFLSLLAVGSRGLILGILVMIGIWIWFQGRNRYRLLLTRILPLLILFALVISVYTPLRVRFYDAFVQRTAQIFTYGKNSTPDYTTLVRLGHFEGYYQLVSRNPWMLLFGAGPAGSITNKYLNYPVSATEISFLTIMLWSGLPYALLYTLWLFRGAWKLWRLRHAPNFTKRDFGLILGAVIFWITANINPQLTTPFAIIAYMLLVVRRSEIKSELIQRQWPV